MALVGNNAEGGTNGVTVTTGNSGGLSGTAFTTVASTGATLVFDNTQAAHGTLSYHCVTPKNTQAFVFLPAASSASYATRFYIRFNALPLGAGQFWLGLANGGGWRNGPSSNQFAINDSTGTTIYTFAATTITTGVWYRLEMEMTRGTTTINGYIAARVYIGDSTTPAEAGYSSSAQNTGTIATNGGFTGGTFGITSLNPFLAFDIWIDDLNIADGTTTPIGPVAAAPTGTASMALAATATAVPAALFAGWGIPL